MTYPRLSTLFVLLCLTLVAGLMFLAPPALAAGPIVTTTDDTDDGTCDAHCSLREAIAAAAFAENITFADSYTITLGAPLVISTSLSIDGSNHAITISGNNAVRVFRVANNAQVTLDTLTVTHGYGGTDFNCSVIAECGGGIKVEAGAVLTLTHSAVISNTGHRGGGIFNDGVLLIAHSTISDNLATLGGGGIDNWNVLTVQNSLVANNLAGNGGGIYDEHPDPGGSLTVEDSRIVDNSAGGGGGIQAESIPGHYAPVIIRNSVIANNSVGGWGGGIQIGVALTITNTTISNNTAFVGGGIQIRGIDPVFITNTTISAIGLAEMAAGLATTSIAPIFTSPTAPSSAIPPMGRAAACTLTSEPSSPSPTPFWPIIWTPAARPRIAPLFSVCLPIIRRESPPPAIT